MFSPSWRSSLPSRLRKQEYNTPAAAAARGKRIKDPERALGACCSSIFLSRSLPFLFLFFPLFAPCFVFTKAHSGTGLVGSLTLLSLSLLFPCLLRTHTQVFFSRERKVYFLPSPRLALTHPLDIHVPPLGGYTTHARVCLCTSSSSSSSPRVCFFDFFHAGARECVAARECIQDKNAFTSAVRRNPYRRAEEVAFRTLTRARLYDGSYGRWCGREEHQPFPACIVFTICLCRLGREFDSGLRVEKVLYHFAHWFEFAYSDRYLNVCVQQDKTQPFPTSYFLFHNLKISLLDLIVISWIIHSKNLARIKHVNEV